MSFFFSKEKSPKEKAREWQVELRKQMRGCDKEIRGIEAQEAKTKRAAKQAAKAGQMGPAKMLAKELVRSQKAKERIHMTKAQLNSVSMQIRSQMATARVAGNLQQSATLMKSMNELMSVSDMRDAMRDMSREMTKAGIMEEMQDDLFEDLDDSDIEEEAQEEIDKVLHEILGEAGHAGTSVLKGKESIEEEEAKEVRKKKEEAEDDALQKRLAALKG